MTIRTIINDNPAEYDFNEVKDTLAEELNKEREIIAIASMGLWNGRCSGYTILDKNNLKEILYCGNKDFNHLYYDGFNVYKKAIHHDDTNHIMFREVRPDVDIEKLCDKIYNNEPIS